MPDPYQQGSMPATAALEQYRQPWLRYAIAQQNAGQAAIPFEQWASQQFQASNQANMGGQPNNLIQAARPTLGMGDKINLLSKILLGK